MKAKPNWDGRSEAEAIQFQEKTEEVRSEAASTKEYDKSVVPP
jgi:hypothetical protein